MLRWSSSGGAAITLPSHSYVWWCSFMQVMASFNARCMNITTNVHLQCFWPEQQLSSLAGMTDANRATVWSTIKPFVNGGASGMLATCVIQPIDMVKVRLQLGAQGSPVSPPSLIAWHHPELKVRALRSLQGAQLTS